MDRKALSAHLTGCEPDKFMAYADLGDQGTVVVGPDGKKFRYSNEQLAAAEAKLKPKSKPRKTAKRKPAAKKSTKPAKKPATKPEPLSKAETRKPKSDPKLL